LGKKRRETTVDTRGLRRHELLGGEDIRPAKGERPPCEGRGKLVVLTTRRNIFPTLLKAIRGET